MASLKEKLLRAGLVSAADAERAEREAHALERRERERIEEEFSTKHVATAPRYPNAKPMTLGAVRALFEPYIARFAELQRSSPIEGILDPEIFTLPSAQFVDGDLEVDDLELEREGSNLLVRGDLRINHLLRQRFGAGGLAVFGSVVARHVVTTGAILCLGDLHVSGTLYGNSTKYATDVLGHAHVATLVSAKEHLFSFWGDERSFTSWAVEGRLRIDDAFDEDAAENALRTYGTLFAE